MGRQSVPQVWTLRVRSGGGGGGGRREGEGREARGEASGRTTRNINTRKVTRTTRRPRECRSFAHDGMHSRAARLSTFPLCRVNRVPLHTIRHNMVFPSCNAKLP